MINELCKYLPYGIDMQLEGSDNKVKLTYSNIEELLRKGYKPILHSFDFLVDNYNKKKENSILYTFFKEIIEIYPTFSIIDRIEDIEYKNQSVTCFYKFCMMSEYSISLHIHNGVLQGISKSKECGEVFNFEKGFDYLRKNKIAVNISSQ